MSDGQIYLRSVALLHRHGFGGQGAKFIILLGSKNTFKMEWSMFSGNFKSHGKDGERKG